MTDRFAHHLRLDQVRDGERLDLVADETERRDVAKRLGLASLERLEAHVCIARTGEVIRAEGRLTAALDQACVVTGDPVAAHVDEPFSLLFMPDPPGGATEDEIELGEADCDTVFYDGAAIDLGTAIADTLALSLDPYPRSAGAEASLKEAGVLTEEQAGPFAVLAKLRKNDET
ncbi:YceD family protein [Sphingomonas sp.]|uniref:YceD family protein n=1 Tax=Sphingomonas sp. TaxID=28214 RepID=UPI0038B1DD04